MARDHDAPPLRERGPTVEHRTTRIEPSPTREIDRLMAKLGPAPRIFCWTCRKLTPFEIDLCEHCGSPFAGATGGAYAPRYTGRSASPFMAAKPEAKPKRSLTEIFEDLQRVHDISSPRADRPWEDEGSPHLYQCGSCGRFVSGRATECRCGARFAPEAETFLCPECASRVPLDAGSCPVCRFGFESGELRVGAEYACPRCGARVTSEAVRCSCGAWFEE